MAKKLTKKQERQLQLARRWRLINWGILVWLANSAFWRILSWIGIPSTFAIKIVFFLASICFAGINITWANGTTHDKMRRRYGWWIAIASEAVMLLPVAKDTVLLTLMQGVNKITQHIGGAIFNTENYKNSSMGVLWLVNLAMAVGVCISILKEEQYTDKNLGFARTPQKRDVSETQVYSTKDKETGQNKVIFRTEKFKQ